MMAIDKEVEWLISQDNETKALFLANLAHALTIAGRDSYTVQTEGLDKPAQLRRINEIQHRVLACLRQILANQPDHSFQTSIPTWVLVQTDAELQELMLWAWKNTREQFS